MPSLTEKAGTQARVSSRASRENGSGLAGQPATQKIDARIRAQIRLEVFLELWKPLHRPHQTARGRKIPATHWTRTQRALNLADLIDATILAADIKDPALLADAAAFLGERYE